MLPVCKCLFAAALTAGLAAPDSSSATLINYVFDHATACFADPNCDEARGEIVSIAGSFTFDTEQLFGPLPKADIALSGEIIGTSPITLSGGTQGGTRAISATNAELFTAILISFAHSLADGTPDPLESVDLMITPPVGEQFNEGTFLVTGSVRPAAVTTREPSSLVVMAAAVGLFFLGFAIPKKGRRPLYVPENGLG